VAERWLVIFGHDTDTRAGYLGHDSKGQIVVAEPVTLA
jgi:hypothetical protein